MRHDMFFQNSHFLNENNKSLALTFNDLKYSYANLLKKANRYQAFYLRNNINRLLLISNNSPEVIFAIVGAILSKVTFCVVQPSRGNSYIQYIYDDLRPDIVLCECSSNTEFLFETINIAEPLMGKNKSEAHSKNSRNENSFACVLYTSGTTGMPKAVWETYDSMYFIIQTMNDLLNHTERDCFINVLSLSYSYGLYQFLSSFYCGGHFVIGNFFQLRNYLSQGNEKSATCVSLVPSMFIAALKTNQFENIDLTNVRYITIAGDYLQPKYIEEFMRINQSVFIVPMYGMTECTRIAVMPINNSKLIKEKLLAGSCGKPLPNTTVSIMNSNGKCMPPYQVGEIAVKGLNVMINGTEKDQGPFYTGDYGYIDEDGFLYFSSRSNDIIKRNGVRISPKEIEQLFLNRFEEIRIAVVGIANEILGEAVFAYIADADNLLQEIESFSKTLPNNVRPDQVVFCQDIPLSINGKIDRRILRQKGGV